ncbi:MAG: outer membrane protein assembly factor BamC [Formosimonas sp.]
MKKTAYKALGLALVLTLSACASSSDKKLDYRSQVKGSPLEVPPGLTDYDKDAHFDLNKGISASQVNAGAGQVVSSNVLVNAKDMHIEKLGDTRWLVINRPAEQIWPVLQDFWEENGFTIRTNTPKVGVMETDWAENRANLPQTGLRKLIGGALDMLYDTGTRDMFRTRMERTGNGTEIYISHRGMEEVYTSSSKDTTSWQPRASDPQLEGELLRRLMVRLGTNEAEASAALQASSSNLVRGATVKGNALILNDVPDNAWRRIGLSLDRVGLSVIDRDYTNRVYYITPNSDDRGLFKKSFGKLGESYQVQLKTVSANQTEVTFADRNGKMLTGDDKGLSKILKELQKTLK